MIIAAIIALLTLGILIVNISAGVKLVCYDKQERAIFIDGEDLPFLENVIAPFWSEDYILSIFDDGNETFIGKYVMEKGEWETLLPVSMFQYIIGEKIDISLFSNFRIAYNGELTFIYDDAVYGYDFITNELEILKACNNISRFEWADDDTLLIFDEMSNLRIGSLKKYNIQTGEEVLIDKSVTDFVFQAEEDQMVYAKKYFMGSWCEYELKYIDVNGLEATKSKRYFNTSIGQLILDSKNNVFVVESILGPDNELEVRRILSRTLSAVYVMKTEGYCIGIK